MRVLVASHSHPQLSKGGAEIAAYQLFKALQGRPGYEPWFLGCVRDQMNQKLGATISQPFSEREYLYSTGAFDWFKFSNADPKFPHEFRTISPSPMRGKSSGVAGEATRKESRQRMVWSTKLEE